MKNYLVTYEYKDRIYFPGSPIYQENIKTTTRTFSFSELKNIEDHVETYDNYIKIISCNEL